MADSNRQSFTDKAASSIKPDSQKTTTEKAGDHIKGSMDSAASTLQPQSQKSSGQKVGDNLSGNSNQNDESLLGKAKSAVGMGEK